MKVAFPLMGDLYWGLQSAFDKLEVNYIPHKPITKKTIELGVKYSPEFSCFPFKVNVGGFIEQLENGANFLLFAGGFGPCRFGYYGQTQIEILKSLGYEFDYLIVEMVEKNQKDFFNKLSLLSGNKNFFKVFNAVLFGYQKLKVLDKFKRLSYYYRPREKEIGITDSLLSTIENEIKNAATLLELKKISIQGAKQFNLIPIDYTKKVIPIALIGEIYTLLEPSINHGIEKKLGRMGLEINKALFLSDWIKNHIFLDALGYDYKKEYSKAAEKYLNREIGGHCRENIGKAVQFIREKGCRGIIHLAPLTCMPEIVTKELLVKISEEFSVPYLSLFLDEQTGEAGIDTRLEAFSDLLHMTT